METSAVRRPVVGCIAQNSRHEGRFENEKPIGTHQQPKKCGNKTLTCESITLTDIQLNQEQKENKEKTMKKATLLSITGLLAIGLVFGANFSQAQSIGGQGPGTLDPNLRYRWNSNDELRGSERQSADRHRAVFERSN